MKKRLALVVPNQRWHKFDLITTWNIPPRTLCQLGACVEDIVDVKIIDAQNYNMSLETFRDEIADYDPHFVGISILSTEYADTLEWTLPSPPPEHTFEILPKQEEWDKQHSH